MKLRNLIGLVAAAAVVQSVMAAGGERDVSLAGPGWRFAKDPTCELRAEAVAFDDAAWEAVRVPHDWAISGPFDESAHGGTGKLPWKGVGWYRRTFTLEPGDVGASVFLDFDGVMASPEVYVNGQKAGGWDYGYASFRVDATPYVKPGVNTLAVRADTRDHRSRWYPGAGIYRKVVMKVRNKAHFAYNGIFVTTPEVSKDAATVRVAWELEGGVPEGAQVEVGVAAKMAALHTGGAQFTAPAAKGSLEGRIEKPALWDVDAPNLYEAEVRLVKGGQTLSCECVRFGIRTIAFPVPLEGPATNDWAANGFHLNGRRVQFKGVDLHSDLGLLGMAFDKSAMRRQLQIMKDMGANALRTSHNCPAPEVLDLCDEMGILVWDEAFDKWDGTAGRRPDQNLEEYVARNLRQFVRRDRNHPCVVIWSMSNEIVTPDYKGRNWADGLTKARCTYFREQMRLEDTTRPVGNGNISWISRSPYLDQNMFDDLDITGWNYGACYRRVKAKYPAKPIVYSESASAFSSYGFYINPPPNGKHTYGNDQFQVDSYDHNAGPDIPDVEFNYMEQDVYNCGEFVWTGIDYLGEPTPYWKESRSSYFGIVDLTGVPKDRFYLYRSYWNKQAETIHILPHWNWKGLEGKTVPVYVYTSGDRAELFLNGRSLGTRRKGELSKAPNMLKDAKVTASSSERDKGNLPEHAIDCDGKTRWCASARHFPEWLQFDMGCERSFAHARVDFESDSAGYAYELQTSLDGATWTTVFAKKKGEKTCPTWDKPMSARYVKVVVQDADKRLFASIRDVYVDKDPLPSLSYSSYYDVCAKYRLRWFDVPYEPGELKAVAYRGETKLGETVMRTAGEPAAVKLTVEPKLGGEPDELIWVQVDVVDAAGVRNPLAMDRVFFKLSGPGQIIGVGNGNAHAFEAFTKTDSHPLFYGKAVAVVRRDAPGALKLTVSASGLTSATAELP